MLGVNSLKYSGPNIVFSLYWHYVYGVSRLVSSDLKVPQGPQLYYFLEKVPVEAILPLKSLYLYIYLGVEAHESPLGQ